MFSIVLSEDSEEELLSDFGQLKVEVIFYRFLVKEKICEKIGEETDTYKLLCVAIYTI